MALAVDRNVKKSSLPRKKTSAPLVSTQLYTHDGCPESS